MSEEEIYIVSLSNDETSGWMQLYEPPVEDENYPDDSKETKKPTMIDGRPEDTFKNLQGLITKAVNANGLDIDIFIPKNENHCSIAETEDGKKIEDAIAKCNNCNQNCDKCDLNDCQLGKALVENGWPIDLQSSKLLSEDEYGNKQNYS
jgi:hypothetical protein